MNESQKNSYAHHENREEHRRIRKNASWLFVGQGIGRALRTFVLIYAARALGVAGWGALSYAISIAAFFTIFSDFGINSLITREVSRNHPERNAYISTAFYMKLFIISALGFISIFLASRITNIEEAAMLMPIVALVVGFDVLRDLGSAIARGLEKMKIESVNTIVTNMVIAGAGFFVLFRNPTSANLMLSYVLGIGIGLAFMIVSLRKDIAGVMNKFRFDLVIRIISTSWPMGIMGLMGIIMINTDIVMIGWMSGVLDVGLYSAGQKVTQLLYLIPTLLASAFFPLLAKSVGDDGKFRSLFEQALSIIFMVAFPLAVGGAILGRPIIDLLYGSEYAAALPSFVILMLSMVAAFPSVLIANAIFAHDKQKGFLIYALVGVFGNIILDLILIPIWGITGAAAATLINQVLINIYFWAKMKKISNFKILGRLRNIMAASLAMGAGNLAMLALETHVLVNISISGAIYFGMLYLLKDGSLYRFIGLKYH